MAQQRDDPAFHVLHRVFNFGLVPGLICPGRDDDGAVMFRHLLIGGVYVEFIAAGFVDGRLGVVRVGKNY